MGGSVSDVAGDVASLAEPERGTVVGAPRSDATLRWAAIVGLVLTLVGCGGVLVSVLTLPAEEAAALNSGVAQILLAVGMAGLATAGAVLTRQQPRSVIAWLMLTTALAWVASSASLSAALALLRADSPLAPTAGWITNWAWLPAQALSMITLLRFPTGRLPSPRWRFADWAVLAWAGTTLVVTALLPGPLGAEALAPLTNPWGVSALGDVADPLLSGLFLVLPFLVLATAASPVVRWRRAGTRERRALRWIAVAAAIVAVSGPLALVAEAGEVLEGLAFLLIPIAIGAAVLREQLWDLDLRRRYDRLRAAREDERERLRHELHDSLGPVLGSISMRAEAARNLLDSGDRARVNELLESIGATTERALDEVRRLIDDLGPAALRDQDLTFALTEQLGAYGTTFPVTLGVSPDPLPALEERAAATAYLVVVEAVRNAARHSGGTHAVVSLSVRGGGLQVAVQDDGRGLGAAPPGLGRAGMAKRVADEGGRLTMADAPGGGTRVTLRLPGALR